MTAGFSKIKDPLYPVRESRRFYSDQLPDGGDPGRDFADESPSEMDRKADGDGDEMPGEWVVVGAKKGMPTGVVIDLKPFLRTMEGLSPDGRGRVQGAAKAGHVAGADLTFSLPKGLSLYLNSLDETGRRDEAEAIRKDAREAVREALDIVHQQGFFVGRRGSSSRGTIRREVVASVPATIWHHRVSRANDGAGSPVGDPQEHIHAYIPNVAKRFDGTWGSLEREPISHSKMMAGALFRAELSHRLVARGVAIREEGRGQFDVAIPRHVVEDFSSRRTAILDRMEADTGERRTDGRRARKAAAVAMDTRAAKETLPPLSEMKREWAARLQRHGMDWDTVTQIAEQGRPLAARPRSQDHAAQVLARLDMGVLAKQDVVAAVASHACADGSMSARDAMRRADEVMSALPRLGKGRRGKGEAMASPGAARRELDLLQAMAGRRDEPAQLLPADARRAAFDLDAAVELRHGPGAAATDKQHADLRRLVSGAGGVQVLAGAGGTGKTETLAAAARAHASAGYQVTAMAPSWNAADDLGRRSDAHDVTVVQRMVADLSAGRRSLRKEEVLFVDDAGAVAAEDLGVLLSHARAAGAKVVLAGDARRAQGKGNLGAGFRAVVEADASHRFRGERPADPALRRAAIDIDAGRVARGLGRLVDDGRVRSVRDPAAALDRAASQAADWIAGDHGMGTPAGDACRRSLAVCATHADAREVGARIRARLRDAGIVGTNEVAVRVSGGEVGRGHVEFDLQVAAGDRLMLHEAVPHRGLLSGDVLVVERVGRDAGGDVALAVRVERDGRDMAMGAGDLLAGSRPIRMQYASAIAVSAARDVHADRTVVAASRTWDREKAAVAFTRHRLECRAVVAVERKGPGEAGPTSRKEREREQLRAWAEGCDRKFERENVADYLSRSQLLAWIRKGQAAAVPGVRGAPLEKTRGSAFTWGDAARMRRSAYASPAVAAQAQDPVRAGLAGAEYCVAAALTDRQSHDEAMSHGKDAGHEDRRLDQESVREMAEKLRELAIEKERQRQTEQQRGRSI